MSLTVQLLLSEEEVEPSSSSFGFANPVGNTIVFDGDLQIFNMQGVEVARGNGSIDVSFLKPGAYVAKSGAKAVIISKK